MHSTSGIDELVACSPVDGGRGSYFNTIYQEGKKIFIRTITGRSDAHYKTWIYAREEVTELDPKDPNYEKAKEPLDNAA